MKPYGGPKTAEETKIPTKMKQERLNLIKERYKKLILDPQKEIQDDYGDYEGNPEEDDDEEESSSPVRQSELERKYSVNYIHSITVSLRARRAKQSYKIAQPVPSEAKESSCEGLLVCFGFASQPLTLLAMTRLYRIFTLEQLSTFGEVPLPEGTTGGTNSGRGNNGVPGFRPLPTSSPLAEAVPRRFSKTAALIRGGAVFFASPLTFLQSPPLTSSPISGKSGGHSFYKDFVIPAMEFVFWRDALLLVRYLWRLESQNDEAHEQAEKRLQEMGKPGIDALLEAIESLEDYDKPEARKIMKQSLHHPGAYEATRPLLKTLFKSKEIPSSVGALEAGAIVERTLFEQLPWHIRLMWRYVFFLSRPLLKLRGSSSRWARANPPEEESLRHMRKQMGRKERIKRYGRFSPLTEEEISSFEHILRSVIKTLLVHKSEKEIEEIVRGTGVRTSNSTQGFWAEFKDKLVFPVIMVTIHILFLIMGDVSFHLPLSSIFIVIVANSLSKFLRERKRARYDSRLAATKGNNIVLNYLLFKRYPEEFLPGVAFAVADLLSLKGITKDNANGVISHLMKEFHSPYGLGGKKSADQSFNAEINDIEIYLRANMGAGANAALFFGLLKKEIEAKKEITPESLDKISEDYYFNLQLSPEIKQGVEELLKGNGLFAQIDHFGVFDIVSSYFSGAVNEEEVVRRLSLRRMERKSRWSFIVDPDRILIADLFLKGGKRKKQIFIPYGSLLDADEEKTYDGKVKFKKFIVYTAPMIRKKELYFQEVERYRKEKGEFNIVAINAPWGSDFVKEMFPVALKLIALHGYLWIRPFRHTEQGDSFQKAMKDINKSIDKYFLNILLEVDLPEDFLSGMKEGIIGALSSYSKGRLYLFHISSTAASPLQDPLSSSLPRDLGRREKNPLSTTYHSSSAKTAISPLYGSQKSEGGNPTLCLGPSASDLGHRFVAASAVGGKGRIALGRLGVSVNRQVNVEMAKFFKRHALAYIKNLYAVELSLLVNIYENALAEFERLLNLTGLKLDIESIGFFIKTNIHRLGLLKPIGSNNNGFAIKFFVNDLKGFIAKILLSNQASFEAGEFFIRMSYRLFNILPQKPSLISSQTGVCGIDKLHAPIYTIPRPISQYAVCAASPVTFIAEGKKYTHGELIMGLILQSYFSRYIDFLNTGEPFPSIVCDGPSGIAKSMLKFMQGFLTQVKLDMCYLPLDMFFIERDKRYEIINAVVDDIIKGEDYDERRFWDMAAIKQVLNHITKFRKSGKETGALWIPKAWDTIKKEYRPKRVVLTKKTVFVIDGKYAHTQELQGHYGDKPFRLRFIKDKETVRKKYYARELKARGPGEDLNRIMAAYDKLFVPSYKRYIDELGDKYHYDILIDHSCNDDCLPSDGFSSRRFSGPFEEQHDIYIAGSPVGDNLPALPRCGNWSASLLAGHTVGCCVRTGMRVSQCGRDNRFMGIGDFGINSSYQTAVEYVLNPIKLREYQLVYFYYRLVFCRGPP